MNRLSQKPVKCFFLNVRKSNKNFQIFKLVKVLALDLSFMARLRTYYSQEIEVWLPNNPGKVVTLYQISRLFGSGYLKATPPNNAFQGISKSGIYTDNP